MLPLHINGSGSSVVTVNTVPARTAVGMVRGRLSVGWRRQLRWRRPRQRGDGAPRPPGMQAGQPIGQESVWGLLEPKSKSLAGEVRSILRGPRQGHISRRLPVEAQQRLLKELQGSGAGRVHDSGMALSSSGALAGSTSRSSQTHVGRGRSSAYFRELWLRYAHQCCAMRVSVGTDLPEHGFASQHVMRQRGLALDSGG